MEGLHACLVFRLAVSFFASHILPRYGIAYIILATAAAASHNASSLETAARLLRHAEREGSCATTTRVTFGQLYGMNDALSYGLSAAGFAVFKYLPFGPVEETIPYLLRRAQENSGIMGGARNELKGLLKELNRRISGKGNPR